MKSKTSVDISTVGFHISEEGLYVYVLEPSFSYDIVIDKDVDVFAWHDSLGRGWTLETAIYIPDRDHSVSPTQSNPK